MKTFQLFWLVFNLILFLHFCLLYLNVFWKPPAGKQAAASATKPRILKPKTDQNCPYCKAQVAGGCIPETICHQHIIPWSMRKEPGGKKKTVLTQGYFCSNPFCYYYLLADESLHALVGFCAHGKYETIQNLRCPFYRKKFTLRRHTVLYRLKTLSTTVAKVLHLLAAGLDPSAAEEVFGIRELTVRTWLARSGAHGQKLHQRFFANLELAHVQLDELWAKVKQSDQEVWVWV